MRMNRLLWFLVSIVVGIFIGVLYGWFIRPIGKAESSLDTLRDDYKADYVLMVAEIYNSEQDINLAISRLSLLGKDEPVKIVRDALELAHQLGYSPEDREMMTNLSIKLMGSESQPPQPAPGNGGEK